MDSHTRGTWQVVAEEFEAHEAAGKWPKFLSMAAGMGLIAAVVQVTERLEATAQGH